MEKAAPPNAAYTALSLVDPNAPYEWAKNLLIHCYWYGGLPSDADRDSLRDLIFEQVTGFFQAGQVQA